MYLYISSEMYMCKSGLMLSYNAKETSWVEVVWLISVQVSCCLKLRKRNARNFIDRLNLARVMLVFDRDENAHHILHWNYVGSCKWHIYLLENLVIQLWKFCNNCIMKLKFNYFIMKMEKSNMFKICLKLQNIKCNILINFVNIFIIFNL